MRNGIIQTEGGKVRGDVKDGYMVFKGIPYAAPPVGKLRWKKPVRAAEWEGIRDGERFPPRCTQVDLPEHVFYVKEFYSNPDYMPEMSEDCLYLNIWTPAKSEEDELPVALWIHGGGFSRGFGSELEFDGEAFCKRNVILVTVNYRLGVFGFLAHPWLVCEDGDNIAGNYGLMDQIAALMWVRRNIGRFGGDSERITIMGQSAGAISVQSLVSGSILKGKIRGAVMQSGGGSDNEILPRKTLEQALKEGEQFVQYCNANTLNELREIPAGELAEKAQFFQREHGVDELVFCPCIDGKLLKYPYQEALRLGECLDIPYLLGSNMQDIRVDLEKLKSGEKGSLYSGCLGWGEEQQKSGNSNTYLYYFKRQLPGDLRGAFHSSELWYMFGTLSRCWRPMEQGDLQLSEKMAAYWCNFISSGNPNGADVPLWQPYSNGRFVMEFDSEEK